MSAGERAVLESLQQRRQELETRARELEVRDSLLKAAERRIEQRLQELKEMEARLTGAAAKKDEAEAAKFKSLVTMYENMKAKDAAKIFDRLDLRILVEVVERHEPAPHVGHSRPDGAGGGRAPHRRACQPLRRDRQGAAAGRAAQDRGPAESDVESLASRQVGQTRMSLPQRVKRPLNAAI